MFKATLKTASANVTKSMDRASYRREVGMRRVVFIVGVLCLIVVGCAVVSAQQEGCLEPTSYPYAEFEFSGNGDLKERVLDFENRLRELESSQGIVYVFGGSRSRIDEATSLSALAEKLFTISKSGYDSKIWILNGGFRTRASFVFIIRPESCSKWDTPRADLTVDQVEFEGFSPEATLRQSASELSAAASDRPEARCPPAARAVRACWDEVTVEVFVLVDATGHVVLAKALNAHPLMRAAAETNAKSWKFPPVKRDGNSMNRSGIANIVFSSPETIDN
jgi:hypothetical protein